jgi:hypothetical protein
LIAVATPQIAASTIVTSLLAPLLTALYAKRFKGRRKHEDDVRAASPLAKPADAA